MAVFFAAKRIYKAIQKNDMAQLQHLLDKGVDPDVVSEFYSERPLVTAVTTDNAEAIAILIKSGAKTKSSSHGWGVTRSLLTIALESQHFEAAKALIECNPWFIDGVSGGKTPLQRAACQGDVETAAWLLAHGADPFIKCSDNRHALYYAQKENREDMIALLTPYYIEEKKRLLPVADGECWEMKNDSMIAHVTVDKAAGFKITDIFNFAVKERMVICQSLTSPQQSTETKSFEDCSAEALQAALVALQEKGGGKGVDSFILTKRF